MGISLKHKFQSEIVDSPQASNNGKVKPSSWNAEHDLVLSQTGVLIGRTSLGAGPAEEVPISAFATADQGAKADSALQSFSVASAIHAATIKSTPVDADELGIVDSAASNALKKLTWANFKTAAKAYFDTIYQANLTSTPREVLTANRTYYVRTDGSNSNNGLANTSGGAFLTVQKAIDVVAALDISIFDVTIQVGDDGGTPRTTPLILRAPVGSGTCYLIGNTTTPTNCTLTTTNANCITADGYIGNWKVRGLAVRTVTGGIAIVVAHGAVLTIDGNMDYGSVAGIHINVSTNGILTIGGNYTISASCTNHIIANNAGVLLYVPGTVTLTGTPAWGDQFINVYSTALVSSIGVTFSGSSTGSRYNVALNAIINSFGSGASYFPGNASGTTATGGQYA